MPSKAKLATRSGTTANTSDNIAKGSKLTFAEMDGNFIGLRDQSFGVVADDSATLDIAAGDTLYIQGGSNVTTSTDSAGVLTINATGEVTASSTTTFTNKTFDANGTGNSLSNVEVADFAAASIVTEAEGISSNDNDTTIPTSAAVKDLVDTSAANTGDITFVGSTINSPSNAAITLDPSGSGTIELNANTNVTGNLTASGSLNTDGIEIHDNNIKASRTNDDLILQTNNTGIVALESNVRVGEDRASGAANATITGGTGQNLSLIGGNADAGEVKVMAGPANGSGETGEIFLIPGASAGVVHVGSGSGNATITSNGQHNLTLRTHDGGTEPHIQLIDGANGNINITPHQGGTGMVSIGNQATLSTGDGGGGRVEIAGMMFEEVGGLAGAGRKQFNAISIPFSADGSTSSDMTIGLDSNADPFIVFNKASDGNNGAKIKVLDGSLLLQTEGVNSSQGNIRLQAAGDITLAPSGNLNLGSDTIVVSGNKMFTDSSNEDFELLANGTGNISMLSQANMNSNKIVNVTDPASAQDAATKAYVDAQDANIASDTLTFTNKTFDAEGTGNSLSNVDVANLKSGVLDTDISSVSGSDDTLASAKAIKTYVDSQISGVAGTGDLSIIGSTISSPSNANLTLTTSGTGVVAIDNLTVDSNINITDNEIKATVTNSDLMLSSSGTGRVVTRDILEIQNNTSGSLTGADKIVFSGSSGTGDKTIECDPLGVGNLNLHLKSSQSGQVKIGHAAEVLIPSSHNPNAGGIELVTSQTSGARADCHIVFNTGDSAGTNKQVVLAPNPEDLTGDSTIRIPGGSTSQSFVGTEATQTMTNKTLTSPVLNTGVSGTAIKDEDDMSSNSATHLATQQSIKSFVDAEDANIASDTLTFTNKTFDAEGTGNSISNIDVADLKSGVLDTDISSVSGSDDTLASAKAIKTYVDSQISGVATGQGFKVIGDDSAGVDIPEAGTLYIQGGTNVTTATDSAGVLTINATGEVTASSTTTFTNKTFDVEATGNSIANIDVADLKSGVLDTDISSVSGSDDTIASAKAIKTYVDSQISGVGSAALGDITFVGSTIISPSNADLTLNPAGTGKVNINAVYTLPNADGSSNQVLGTNGSGVLSFRDPTAINIDGGVADSTYTSVPTIDGGTA